MKPQTRCGGGHQGGKSIGCMGYARSPSQQHTRQDSDLLECRQVISRWQESVQALSIQRKTDERSYLLPSSRSNLPSYNLRFPHTIFAFLCFEFVA
ncbi:unnamed protein product [Sphagnum troendelagicum]